MKKPSVQQQKVYTWAETGNGSLQLVARAGCGKTSTLIGTVETIMKNNLGDILLMAYNKEIANELKDRIAKMGYDWKKAQASTCHAVGYSAWRYVAGHGLVIDEKKVKNIISEFAMTIPEGQRNVFVDCSEAIEKMVSYGKSNAIGYYGEINDTANWYGLYDHFGLDTEVSEDWKAIDVINAVIPVYQRSLNSCRQVIDFDDMILAPLYFKARFFTKDFVMLDEAQDANPARRALALKLLKPKTGRLIYVGDDRQAIYGFTGADAESMANIQKATNATTLTLTNTYRCGKAIVREAQRIVPDIEAHESNIEGKVSYLMSDKLAAQGLTVNDAILCRNVAPLIETAYDLLGKGIACRVEGRDIGAGIIKLAQRWKVSTLSALLERLDTHLEKQRAKYIAKGQEEKIESLEDQVSCLKVIITRCQSKNKQTVAELVDEVKNMFGDTEPGKKPNAVTLSSIHRSKGREWKRVFILGREKYMPSKYARKEWQQTQEANLEYVAITRAIEELVWVTIGETEEKPVEEVKEVEVVETVKEEVKAAPEAAIQAETPVVTGPVIHLLIAVTGGNEIVEEVSFDKLKLEQMAAGNNEFAKKQKIATNWVVETKNII